MINTLTGLRGYAALSIVFFHILWNNREYYDMGIGRLMDWTPMKMFYLHLWVAVDVFFILSGFILTYKYYQIFIDRFSFKNLGLFILKRFLRIYPLHFISLMICFAFYLLGMLDDKIGNVDALIYHLTLTFTWWFYPEEYGGTWNIPSWSLSAEWFSYFFFIPIIYIFKNNIKTTIFGILAILTIVFFYGLIYPGDPFASGKRALLGLLFGYFIFHIYNHEKIKNLNINKHSDKIVYMVISLLLIITLYLSNNLYYNPLLYKYFFVYTFIVIALSILFLPKCTGIMKFMFDNRVIMFLGNISYSIYIFQYPIYIFMDRYKYPFVKYMIIDDQLSQLVLWLFVIGVIFLIIIFATIMHYLIEKPLMNYFKARLILK